jgi:broad specificity phosphatase PhoE
MKVGLVRHFKVNRGYPNKIVTTNDLMQWLNEYDLSDVEEKKVDLADIKWEKCIASDLKRAKITAESIFEGEIIYLEELREIPLIPFIKLNIKMPLIVHMIFIRIAWLFNHKSQYEHKRNVLDRLNQLVEEIVQTNKDVLIVSHGGIMMYLRKELLKRGFKGPKFSRAESAKLYTFEK